MPTKTIRNIDELEAIVDEVYSMLPGKSGANVITLSGELGAGKTTFTQLLARKLGVTEHVTSPTFTIMRSYEASDDKVDHLVHIDAYRIEDEREIEVLHIPELFKEERTVICIEWPEKIPNLIPTDAVQVLITLHDDGSRLVMYR